MVKSNENPLIFTNAKPLEQQGESCEFLDEFYGQYFMARRKGILGDNHKKVGVQCACMMKQELIRNPH